MQKDDEDEGETIEILHTPQTHAETKKKSYFIACARCYQMKAYDGTIDVHEDSIVWLGWDPEYHYPVCTKAKSGAHKFKSSEDIRERAHNWDGMPYQYRLKPDTLQIFEVKVETRKAVNEQEVTDES